MRVACKGSGTQLSAGFNAKRGTCPSCGEQQDLTGAGKIRKHMRVVTKQQLRKM